MGILKDWIEDNKDYTLRAKVGYFFSPKVWLQLHRWRKQRLERGWSDRDAWGAGDHIARMTAEMLQHLQDKGYTDWPEWFKLNVQEEGRGAYNDLQTVINDINNYLDFSETCWSDGLDSVNKKTGKYSVSWIDENGHVLSEATITNRINKHWKEHMRLYNKAKKAMGFFSRHFTQFWD